MHKAFIFKRKKIPADYTNKDFAEKEAWVSKD